ncbi:tetratricopeptide repeat protein, partial [Thiothrix subterranea]
TLADNDPSNAGWQRDLAASLSKMGEVLTAQGKLDDAKAVFEKSRDIAQTLADNDPSNAGWQADVVVSHAKLMFIALEKGNKEDAQKHIKAALLVLEPLEKAGLLNASQQDWPEDMRKRLKALE